MSKAGQLDAEAKITGSDQGESLRAALDRLVRPLGLHRLIRDEVVLLTR